MAMRAFGFIDDAAYNIKLVAFDTVKGSFPALPFEDGVVATVIVEPQPKKSNCNKDTEDNDGDYK